jgi:AcrR family transcriptional regulator
MAPEHRGRPRDTTIDDRAIAATLDLLTEVGYEQTTIQSVAKRAGLHASALYRRWHSRVELIEAAVFPGFDPPDVRPTGDLRADLRRLVRVYAATLTAPAARAAMPGLLAHYQASGMTPAPDQYLRVSARPQFQDILCAAPDDAVDPDLNPDDVFDLLLGAILGRVLVPTIYARRRPLDRTVDLIVRLLRQPAVHKVGG